MAESGLRVIAPAVVLPGPYGVAVRTRLKGMSTEDGQVLRLVGAHLGSLASRDLKARCSAGLEHNSARWAARKRELTAESSSRWAGSITKASRDQWALARRCQASYAQSLRSGIETIERRVALPIGTPSNKGKPGGYRTRLEWFGKSRRLGVLRDRLATVEADRVAGRVRVVRGGRRLLNQRHHLDTAGMTTARWQERWQAERWFLQADGEAGKRLGNETIRVSPDGKVSIRLPAPLTQWANAPSGRYVLSAGATFAHRGLEWTEQVTAGRAVAYRIHYDVRRGRWYITASWQRQPAPIVPLPFATAGGVVGVDMNDDHLACWRLDRCGNPVGDPRRFYYDLSGRADHRDAQIRHALTRLLHWTNSTACSAIAIEDLDFSDAKTREKHGRGKRFRRLISRFPTGRLLARLVSMAAAHGMTIIAVDPAYTSRWGAQHWQQPLTTRTRKVSRHDAAGVAIGRRALGHSIRRRTAPPPRDQSDHAEHRTAQTGPTGSGARGNPPPPAWTTRTTGAARPWSERGQPGRLPPFGASGRAGLVPARSAGTVAPSVDEHNHTGPPFCRLARRGAFIAAPDGRAAPSDSPPP